MTIASFSATCCGASFDAAGLTAHVKAEHKGGVMRRDSKGRPLTTAHGTNPKSGYAVPKTGPKVSPKTVFEKEWIGAYVSGAPELLGRVGQIWAESGRARGAAWVVIPNHDGTANEVVEVRVDRLVRAEVEEAALFAA